MLRFWLPLLATLCLAACSLNPKGELPGETASSESDPSGFGGDDEGPGNELIEPGATPDPNGGLPGVSPPPGEPPAAMPGSPSTPIAPTPVNPADPGPDDDDTAPDENDGGHEPFDGGREPEPQPDASTNADAGVTADGGLEVDANAP